MSYYVYSFGEELKFKKDRADELLESVLDHMRGLSGGDVYSVFRRYGYDLDDDGEYYYIEGLQDTWLCDSDEFMKEIAPYMEDGEICFRGEDDCTWKYIYKDGVCKEVSGTNIILWEDEVVTKDNEKGHLLCIKEDDYKKVETILTESNIEFIESNSIETFLGKSGMDYTI